MSGIYRTGGTACSAATPVLCSTRRARRITAILEIDIDHDLTITKRTLFSRRTERLYYRPRFGDMLKARQERYASDTLDYDIPASNNGKSDGAGRVKKKAKGKK